MREPNDWRLINQERYLKGATLIWGRYAPANSENDHDHCEFCRTKFMTNGQSELLHEGYSTPDGYRWICSTCFDDFVDMFGWHVQRVA
jgi:hypothetical protein